MASMSCYSWLSLSLCGNYKMMMMQKKKKMKLSLIHRGGGGRFIWFNGCASKSKMMGIKCFSAKQDVDDDFEMDYRLFSNLNQSTFKREPGISISLLYLYVLCVCFCGCSPLITSVLNYYS